MNDATKDQQPNLAVRLANARGTTFLASLKDQRNKALDACAELEASLEVSNLLIEQRKLEAEKLNAELLESGRREAALRAEISSLLQDRARLGDEVVILKRGKEELANRSIQKPATARKKKAATGDKDK